MNLESRITFWREFALHPDSRRFFYGDHELLLTRREFDLLALLFSKPDQVFSRAQILKALNGDAEFRAESIIYSHISRIRGKVRSAGGPTIIKAVHGIGFRLEK